MGQAPVGDLEGDDGVDDHGQQGGGGEPPVEPHHHDAHGQHQLHRCGTEVEHHAADQEIGGARAALDHPGQGPGLLALVEIQGQGDRMAEPFDSCPGHGRLGDCGKHSVAGEGRAGRQQAQACKGERQGYEAAADRHDAAGDRQGVDGLPQHHRRDHRGQLADQHQHDGGGQTQAQLRRAGSHDQLTEIGHGRPEPEVRGERQVAAVAAPGQSWRVQTNTPVNRAAGSTGRRRRGLANQCEGQMTWRVR